KADHGQQFEHTEGLDERDAGVPRPRPAGMLGEPLLRNERLAEATGERDGGQESGSDPEREMHGCVLSTSMRRAHGITHEDTGRGGGVTPSRLRSRREARGASDLSRSGVDVALRCCSHCCTMCSMGTLNRKTVNFDQQDSQVVAPFLDASTSEHAALEA